MVQYAFVKYIFTILGTGHVYLYVAYVGIMGTVITNVYLIFIMNGQLIIKAMAL